MLLLYSVCRYWKTAVSATPDPWMMLHINHTNLNNVLHSHQEYINTLRHLMITNPNDIRALPNSTANVVFTNIITLTLHQIHDLVIKHYLAQVLGLQDLTLTSCCSQQVKAIASPPSHLWWGTVDIKLGFKPKWCIWNLCLWPEQFLLQGVHMISWNFVNIWI